MKSIISDVRLIKATARTLSSYLPKRHLTDIMSGIDYQLPQIKRVENYIEDLLEGRFLVLAGPIGVGKTLSACLAAIYYHWEKDVLRYYEAKRASTPEDEFDLETPYKLLKEFVKFREYEERAITVKFVPSKQVITDSLKDCILPKFKGLLIIDDVGVEPYSTDKEFTIGTWDYLIDERYSWCRPTIITTNLTPTEFSNRYNLRILDRIKGGGIWFSISGKSLRGNPKS